MEELKRKFAAHKAEVDARLTKIEGEVCGVKRDTKVSFKNKTTENKANS